MRTPRKADPHGQTEREAKGRTAPATPTPHDPYQFDPDHPISPGYKEDRLGFRSVANMLASSLLTQATARGLVVSIEGVWGSGKSSLVNLLEDELYKDPQQAPAIVRFEPWLIGDRDGMLAELMGSLASAVTSMTIPQGSRHATLKKETKALATKLLGYASQLSRQAAPLARLAGNFGMPGGELASKTFETASKALESLDAPRPLAHLKRELTRRLSKLRRRIVVIIDDLDRLEPQEAAEITRLIRAVADFPNIIYVVCYDPSVLASHLQTVVSVDNGAAFLEKIVQVTFKVPQPEEFDLRRWLLDECALFYSSTSERELSNEQMRRLYSVCNTDGGLTRTPRDVVRIMNAIKLHWPPISEKADYADLVWLQLIKLTNDELYSWIESYLTEYVAFSEGALIGEAHRIDFGARLKKYLSAGDPMNPLSMWRFKTFIPGVMSGKSDKETVFNREAENVVSSFEQQRRLGSPQHSRYFFALSKPGGALEDSELKSFVSSAEAEEELDATCMALAKEMRPQGNTKFELLIARLNRLDDASLPDKAVPSILMALANCMDKVSGKGHWGLRWPWESAERLFEKLAGKLSGDHRKRVIHGVFANGESVGWLMNVIRQEMWGHGWVGDRAVAEGERLLSEGELKEAVDLLLSRFRSKDRGGLVNAPELLSLMYGWKEAGDEGGVLEWVREQVATDAGFLSLLSGCRGWMQSDKVYRPLNRRDLGRFLDFDEMRERLRGISEDPDRAQHERRLAKELSEAAELGNKR